MAILALLAMPALAQTNMTIKPTPQRVEVAVGNSSTYYVVTCPLRVPTNGASGLDSTGTNWVIANVDVSISGAPAGCTATLVDSGQVNPIGSIPINMNTNNASFTTNLIVKLVFDGTEVSGTTNLVITATGAGLPEDDFIMPLDVAKIWNGSTNAAADGAGNWSDAAQWLGGAPQAGDVVVFTDAGEQTNTLLNGSAYLTNSLVDANVTISSLRFALTNANYQNLYINPGVNLAINGDGGFSALRDYSYWNKRMFINIGGTNGTLIQTNENSSFTLLFGDDQQQSILDMSGLGSLYLDVNRLNIDTYQGHPTYLNMVYTNAINGTTVGTGKPQKIYGTWNMAMTNYVRSTFVDPYNYTNALSRDYALTLGRNDGSGGGSGKDCNIFMGYSNVFNLDSICISGPSSYGANLEFLNTNSIAIFRNADGVSRMSVFATADLGGQGIDYSFGDKSKCGGSGPGVDFTKGTVDMLVDRLYLSLDGTTNDVATSGSFAGYSQTSGFYVGAGIIDANTAIFGYQSQGFVSATATNNGTCYANVYVTNTAVLKVNDTLTLGYTTSLRTSGSYGALYIGPGGTVIANTINVGGPAKSSTGNKITMTSGATLVVSNTIASTNDMLDTLSFGGNCTNVLFVDGSITNPYVYVTNLSTTGVGNTIQIAGIQNLAFPAVVPLISYQSGSPSLDLALPPGYTGALLPATINGFPAFEALISTNPPKNLVWRGGNGTWDNSSKVWLDQDTGLMTNFANGDVVSFDDNSGTTISLDSASSPLIPTAINVTNNSLSFVFNGSGFMQGSAPLNKWGTQNVEFDASTTTPLQLNQGSFSGTGTIGGPTIAAGAVLNFGGTINGVVDCAGTATLLGSSTVKGPLIVETGGIVTNACPNFDCQTLLSVNAGGYLYNATSGVLDDFTSPGNTIAAGGVVLNDGQLGNGAGIYANQLVVSGILEDTGLGSITVNLLTVNSGGQFIPGGDSIGTTVVNQAGPAGTGLFPGRVHLNPGATVVLKVNPGTPANTLLQDWFQDFGASASVQTQNGCTLMITNVSGTPFAAGQQFRFFENPVGGLYGNTGSSTNTYPVIVPATPGPGLAWDLRYLWYKTGGINGIIGVVDAAAAAAPLTNAISQIGTNVVANLAWPAQVPGWRLETQNNPLSVGLSNNWTGIAGSWTNSSMLITNKMTTNTAVFYRLVFP